MKTDHPTFNTLLSSRTKQMPPRLTTPEEIQAAWEKKRERNRLAQERWNAAHYEEHLARMRERYARKKAEEEAKAAEDAQKAYEDMSLTGKILFLKRQNPLRSQTDIAEIVKTSQTKVSRVLSKEKRRIETLRLNLSEENVGET